MTLPNEEMLPEVAKMLSEGNCVKLKAKGNSMLPFIVGGRDEVVIEKKLFTDAVDWELLLKMASMQTVCGVLYEGIQKLPSELQPPTLLMRKLYQRVIRMEQSHGLLNQGLTEFVCREGGVWKGLQSVAGWWSKTQR